jgi:hypothetical protein
MNKAHSRMGPVQREIEISKRREPIIPLRAAHRNPLRTIPNPRLCFGTITKYCT